MVNIVVVRKTTAGIIETRAPVTLKNVPIGSGITRLDQLADVDATTETNNGVLTYDSSQDKYIIKLITFDEIVGDLDGGNF
jgi:hypothetical protein